MLNRQWSGIVFSVLMSLLLLSACGDKNAASGPRPEVKILNIYNWPDYIAKDMIANFEKEFGVKVNYQNFENNESLQSQLIAGSTGYDIVVPGAVFAKAQIAAGLYQPLDKKKTAQLRQCGCRVDGQTRANRPRQRLPYALGLELYHGRYQQGQGGPGAGHNVFACQCVGLGV